MVMHPKSAPTGYARSPEPEIAKKHFGFEFWLTVALFLFAAGMIIAQWLFSALVKPAALRQLEACHGPDQTQLLS
jgi:hypothetical protein